MLPAPGLAVLGGVVACLTAGAVAATGHGPVEVGAGVGGWLSLHLALFLAAGIGWALALVLLPRLVRRPGDLRVIWVLALAVRIPAWFGTPAHSDDVYRYAWDGRVTRAGINPYRYAPAAPELDGLREGVRYEDRGAERAPPRPSTREPEGPLWGRINNPDLPTIYPPAAQFAFALAAMLPLGPLGGLKCVLGACDLGVLAVLMGLLRRRGEDPRWALAWGWSPLVAVELGQNVHLDALPLLALVGGLWAWEVGRKGLAGVLLGVATAAKLITAPLIVAFRSGRVWGAMVGVTVLLALPFVGARLAIAGSTGEFARRWRTNDGVFALVQAGAERVVCPLQLAIGRRIAEEPPSSPEAPLSPEAVQAKCSEPLDLKKYPAVAHAITGRSHRVTVFPDELAAFASRAVAGAAIGLVVLVVLGWRLAPLAGTEWILGALLLLTPALHPWYVVWLVPLVALRRRAAWVALAMLVPLGYVPLATWLAGGPWRDPWWTRGIEHGVCWALLVWDGLRAWRRRSEAQADPVGGGEAILLPKRQGDIQ